MRCLHRSRAGLTRCHRSPACADDERHYRQAGDDGQATRPCRGLRMIAKKVRRADIVASCAGTEVQVFEARSLGLRCDRDRVRRDCACRDAARGRLARQVGQQRDACLRPPALFALSTRASSAAIPMASSSDRPVTTMRTISMMSYRSLNSTATSTITSTGVPNRRAGEKRHCLTASIARRSSPAGQACAAPSRRQRYHRADDDLEHDVPFDSQAPCFLGVVRPTSRSSPGAVIPLPGR